MSSSTLSGLVFRFQVHQRIQELQTELCKVMQNPECTASERDALIGSIAELRKVEMQYEPRRHAQRGHRRRGAEHSD
jgi:hypothetical protein